MCEEDEAYAYTIARHVDAPTVRVRESNNAQLISCARIYSTRTQSLQTNSMVSGDITTSSVLYMLVQIKY